MVGEGRAQPGTGSWSGTRNSFPRSVRRAILRRDGECMLRLPGCTGDADEADHIISHADATRAGWDPADIDDPGNGRAVCRACHTQVTRAQQQRGQQRRRASGLRPKAPHPGLIR